MLNEDPPNGATPQTGHLVSLLLDPMQVLQLITIIDALEVVAEPVTAFERQSLRELADLRTALGSPKQLPEAWAGLLEALTILATGQCNATSPLHCEHDTLTVMADPKAFTDAQVDQLDGLGFSVDQDDETFYSFKYGSA